LGLRTSFSYNSSKYSYDFYIDYSQATAGWFKEFFQYTKSKEILNQYKLYEFKEFRRYIKAVPGYKEHIQEIHKELKIKSKRKKKLENVKEIIEEMYNTLVEQGEQINQLQSLHTMYTDHQVVRGAMCKVLSRRL
jgi:GTP1/Obg family GTP-binding protein